MPSHRERECMCVFVCVASLHAYIHFLCAEHVHRLKCIMLSVEVLPRPWKEQLVHNRCNNHYKKNSPNVALSAIHKRDTHMPAHTPLMLIAGIRCIHCVACKCVCHYWASENLQLHRNNMLQFSQSQAFVQIESSMSERVWRECDKETLGCFAAIFRSTPI